MRYIDADKLISEIERLREEYNNSIPVKVSIRKLETKDFICMGIVEVLDKVLLCAHDSIIQQEQPAPPSNLDEAAEEFGKRQGIELAPFGRKIFKAGAEWMAGQGVTKEAVIGMATEEISINVPQRTLNELDLCPGDKVVVQIRKK